MHPNEQLIRDFYAAFARRDAAAMARCYHPDIFFSDPAFPSLRGPEATAMWAMLTARGKDLEIILVEAAGSDDGGSARWDAIYTFSQTGRKVHNKISAMFAFKDGKIVRHIDRFGFWTWSKQALGAPGLLLGWFGPFKGAVRKKADKSLRAYMQQHAGEIPLPG
ncbi:MAG: nuclear transport factor 2 family protein [Betaproteobacteria bacterium]|nr:nuclear transport factor 2 family protein [Betaproteobacteria bacterium]